MPDVSFLLPTRTSDRNPKDFVLKSIDNINDISGKQNKYSYEILVYSEHEVVGKNVKWFKEETLSDGCVGAYNNLVKVSNGKWLVHSVDDCSFDDNFYSAVDLLESYVYNRRRIKILSLGSDDGLGASMPPGHPRYGVYRYPIVGKETVDTYFNGYMYNPNFKNHYADNWLGYWLTSMFGQIAPNYGESMIEVWNTTIHIGPPTSYNHHDNYDQVVFEQIVNRFHTTNHKSYV